MSEKISLDSSEMNYEKHVFMDGYCFNDFGCM